MGGFCEQSFTANMPFLRANSARGIREKMLRLLKVVIYCLHAICILMINEQKKLKIPTRQSL